MAQVTDAGGNLVCGTTSSNPRFGEFDNINTNAQQFFGGMNVKRTMIPILTETTAEVATWTFQDPSAFTSTATETAARTKYEAVYDENLDYEPFGKRDQPTGVVISLTTPFIYQPERGATGATGINTQACFQGTGSINYGYIPQTLVDFLIQNPQYSSQFPGLESCVPGGPPVSKVTCPEFSTATEFTTATVVDSTSGQTAVGGDLTEMTTVYVTAPGVAKSIPNIATPPTPVPIVSPSPEPPAQPPTPAPKNPPDSPINNPTPAPKNPGNTPPSPPPPAQQPTTSPDLGGLINSIMGFPLANTPTPSPQPQPQPQPENNNQPIVIPSPTTIPAGNAPAGLTGETTMINNSPFIIVPNPTTIPAQGPAAQPPVGSPTVINGSPMVVILGPTSIPLANAPAGLGGSTSTINGVPYLIVTGPATVPAPAGGPTAEAIPGGQIGVTTMLPFLIIPATTLPVANAPPGLAGETTTINGTPMLVIPAPTTIPAPPPPAAVGSTTMINGSPFVVIPGATTVPLAGAPTGIPGASTTLINGTPMLVIPGAVTVAAPQNPAGAGSLGSTTMINGSPFVVIPGGTTVPLAGAPTGLSGAITTTINGTPMLVIPSGTTIPIPSPTPTGTLGGQLTVIIDGTSELVIAGPTTIPVNSDFSIAGSTEVIGGTTMVVVSWPTTVKGAPVTKSTSSTSSSSSTTTASPSASTTKKGAAARGLDVKVSWACIGVVLSLVLGLR